MRAWLHNAVMATVNINVRHVPEDVRDTLAARAEREGKSLQQYTLDLLIATARQPQMSEVLARMERIRIKHAAENKVDLASILAAKDDDR
jgi:antitoxin FitA